MTSTTISTTAYSLTFTDGLPTGCTCPGFGFRGKCRHIAEHTGGGYLVYCAGCMGDCLTAVTYDAARAFARSLRDQCPSCGRRELCVAPDWDARIARNGAMGGAA